MRRKRTGISMISAISALLLSAMPMRPDTTIVLGIVGRDLTGDGRPEVLQLVGTGKSLDSLHLTLSIEAAGKVIFTTAVAPLTRRVGFDADRRMRTSAQQRQLVSKFGRLFFADEKFVSPVAFTAAWGQSTRRLAEVPVHIARDGRFYPDTARARSIWDEMQRTTIAIFEFSSGGDAIVAIGWSPRDRRFYRIMECC